MAPRPPRPHRHYLRQLSPKARRGRPDVSDNALDAESVVRAEKAVNLRLAGMTYEQINRTMGFKHKSTAYRIIQAALHHKIQEPSEKVRQMELLRLDQMWLALESKARAGDVQAIDRQLKILERRARYLGLDAPEKREVSGSVEFQWRIDERVAPRAAVIELEPGGDGTDWSTPALPEAEGVR